jgi:hypothetical protein
MKKPRNWKKIAKNLARAIVRYDKNIWAGNVSERATRLAYSVSKKKFD